MFAMASSQRKQQTAMKVFIQALHLSCIQPEGLGPTCAHAQCSFAVASGCVRDWDLVQREGAACLPLPVFPSLLVGLSSCCQPHFALRSAPSFHAVFKLWGLNILGVVLTGRAGKWEQCQFSGRVWGTTHVSLWALGFHASWTGTEPQLTKMGGNAKIQRNKVNGREMSNLGNFVPPFACFTMPFAWFCPSSAVIPIEAGGKYKYPKLHSCG